MMDAVEEDNAEEKAKHVAEESSLRFKLEMFQGQTQAAQELDKLFKKVAKKHGMIFSYASGPIKLSDGSRFYFELDYEVKIESSNFIDELFRVARHFFFKCNTREVDLRFDMMPSFFLASPRVFFSQCIPAHLNVASSCLLFGTIVNNGALGVHWRVEFGTRFPGPLRAEIVVNFEYDEKKISAKFERIEDYFSHKDNSKKTQLVSYTVKWELAMIRRILVDPICISSNVTSPNSPKAMYRLFFQLDSPPLMWRFYTDNTKEPDFVRYGDGKRVLQMAVGTDNSPSTKHSCGNSFPESIADSNVIGLEFLPGQPHSFRDILSRLRTRAGLPIEIVSFALIDMTIGKEPRNNYENISNNYWKVTPYVDKPTMCAAFTHRLVPIYAKMAKEQALSLKNEKLSAEDLEKKKRKNKHKLRDEEFRLRYLLDALLSKGSVVKNQLLVAPENWAYFLERVLRTYSLNKTLCLRGLEDVLGKVLEMKKTNSILRLFIDSIRVKLLSKEEDVNKEGFQRVRKILITPTRMILGPPEMIMGNRVIRMKDPGECKIIRIQFRDDNGLQMNTSLTSSTIIEKRVLEILRDGIDVGGRHFSYLGSSNSQMRDHGAYFFDTTIPPEKDKDMSKMSEEERRAWKLKKARRQIKNINRLRCYFGKFENLSSVPKFMARLGQCFTQSMQSGVSLPKQHRERMADYEGGSHPLDGEVYCFSDGVGQMSMSFAQQITKDLELGPSVPCAYQFRQRGCKGMLTVTPTVDKMNELRRRARDYREVHGLFRPSLEKFKAPEGPFEVVKYSAPVPVSLNKPFINILDQVSEMQSTAGHARMCDRIEELLEIEMRRKGESLIKETPARNRLKELPGRVHIDELSTAKGFALTTEPYFRSLLKASMRFVIRKQLNKQQIPIPVSSGRSMFGVVDETGILQYGQIFVQYHTRIDDKVPKKNAMKRILTGKVLVTKMPCIVAGDVRLFEAVDVADLQHLVDVIVFPQHGPRPHPDEMAGSDLDGDEYSVIWDPRLYIEKNEPAMIFPKGKAASIPINRDDPEILDEQMRTFYKDYMISNSIGIISNAHIANSDLYGITSAVCMSLAHKNAQSLDFPKTGEAPKDLTKKWEGDYPPEKPERSPDFMQKTNMPTYASARLLGRIFRSVQEVSDVLKLSEMKELDAELHVDDLIDCEGWQEYEKNCEFDLNLYNNSIMAVMDQYGIQSEGELLSGCISYIRNGLVDKEDKMSLFNTTEIIEKKVTQIVRYHRERFFLEFGGYESCTEKIADKKFRSDDDVLDRLATFPGVPMKKKAVAAYKVCYTKAALHSSAVSPRLLSYAWIAYDVLAKVKQESLAKRERSEDQGAEPIHTMLKTHMKSYMKEKKAEYDSRVMEWSGDDTPESIRKYLSHYKNLAEMCFLLVSWATRCNLFSAASRFQPIHFILLFIQFGLGNFSPKEQTKQYFLLQISGEEASDSAQSVITNEGKVILSFFEFLSSRAFKKIKHLQFSEPDLGERILFSRGEWITIHECAVQTYYDLVFSFELDLPITAERRQTSEGILKEMQPFVIELPCSEQNLTDEDIENRIVEVTGATQVKLRRPKNFSNKGVSRVIVSAVGPLSSHSMIRSLLIIFPPLTTEWNSRQTSAEMPYLLLDKIMGYERNEIKPAEPSEEQPLLDTEEVLEW